MFGYFKYLLFILIILFLGNFVFASETLKEQFNAGLGNTAIQTGHVGSDGAQKGVFEGKTFAEGIGSIVSVALGFVGVMFMVLLIYGGFVWMTARGNEQEAEKAKKIITNSIIGLIIVFSAYAFVWFISEIYYKDILS